MSVTAHDTPSAIMPELMLLVSPLDAMHLAQLAAFAFSIPQLYFCREYLVLTEQDAFAQSLQRLQKGINEQQFNVDTLTTLLAERDYFDADEARLRLAPAPEDALDDE